MQLNRSFGGSTSARAFALALFLAVVLVATGRGAGAAGPVTRTWTGDGANGNWTTQANWNPAAPNPGDILVFPSVAARKSNTNDYPAGTVFTELRLQGSGYALGGNRIELLHGLNNTPVPAGTNTINLVLDGEGGITSHGGTLNLMAHNLHDGMTSVFGGTVHAGHNNAFGQFSATVDVLAGTVSLADGVTIYNPLIIGGPASPALKALGDAAWDAPISVSGHSTFGAVQGATLRLPTSIFGPFGILKTGPGTVVLSGENTFSGALTVAEGVLSVTRPEALGSPFGGTVIDGGTLEFDVALMAEPITINGDGHDGGGALRSLSGINHLGNVLIDSDATVTVVEGTLRLPNGIDQAGEHLTLTMTGDGTLEIEDGGDFDGTIAVLEGWLSVRGDLLASVDVDGGELKGDGSTGSVRLLSGWLTPGIHGTGTLTVEGDFEAGPEGSVHITIDAGNSYTALRVTGLVSLESPTLWIDGDGDVPLGGTVTLIENTGPAPIDGEFALREEGSDLIVGETIFFQITYAGGPDPANDMVLAPLPPDSADAALALLSTPQGVPSGGQVPLVFRATNAGPDAATSPEVTITAGAGLAFVSLTAPAGWGCQTPVVGAPGDIVCTRQALAPGEAGDFHVVFSVTAAAGASVVFTGQLTHASAEEDPADNTVDVSVGVSPAGQQPFRRALPGLASDGSW